MKRMQRSPKDRDRLRRASIALCIVGLLAGCLQESSRTCASGGVCPPGRQCADSGDDRICILVTCGNGRVDPGEACDDTNTRSGDGCPADCTAPCGDGVRDPDEVCDDGNTNDGDGCAADCLLVDSIFLVSPTVATFTAIEGDVMPAPVTVSVRLLFRGDTVLVGYPPGVSQPSWLSFSGGASTGTTAEFRLQVNDTTVVGSRTSTVRFALTHENSTGLEIFDLPITYGVRSSDLALQATPATLAFIAVAGGIAPPPRSVQVTFNGADAAVLAVPSWMTVSTPPSPVTSPAVLGVGVNSTAFAAGTVLSGDIVLRTTRGTLTRTSALHVTYNIVESAPEVEFVAPYVGIAGRGGTLRVRGRGFQSTPAPVTVGVGALEIGQVIPDSDTQMTVSYPPLPVGRYPVTFNPANGNPSSAELVIVAPPAFAYQAVDAPSDRTRIIYDAERQAIYAANRLDQQVERFVYSGGAWSALPPRVMPQLTDVALAPNGRALMAIDRDAINEISLTDNLFAPVRRVDNPDPFCGGFFDQAVPANHGKFFVVFNLAQCSGSTSAYLYDMRTHLLSPTTSLYNGLAAASADGSRIYAGSNGLSPEPGVSIFNSLSNTTSGSIAFMNLYAVSVSGDASRVVLQNRLVYSRSLTLLGNVPNRGPVLASRDSSRAFIYAEDGEGARLEVYDLNGPLQAGALFPLLKTVMLPDAANGAGGFHPPVAMTSSPDDSVVFVSGDSKLLVVPVN
jgi:cysteine-rich repeat protein